MTLPSQIIFPLRPETLNGSLESVENYLRELTVALQDMYEQTVFNVNGTFLINRDTAVSAEDSTLQWTPTLKGTTTEGSFTYTKQDGWALRQGLLTDVWFDVAWTATGGAAGNLYIELPYEVALTPQKPFVGVVQSSGFAYTGGTGIVLNAITDTYRGEFWNVGSGFTTANQAVVSSGELIGHIRYIGKTDEE